jgi:uncharacterized membrane protein
MNPREKSILSVRWLACVLILAAYIGIGAVLRFHQIDKQSLWLDEYWAEYLATGRGNSVLASPRDVVLDPPPDAGFENAPPFWAIWTGITTTTHPPLYHFVLRWWIDVFGNSDTATRAFSAILSLGSIILLFEMLRKQGNTQQAIIAAGLMAFAVTQIDFSQQVRPYTLLLFLSLLSLRAMLRIDSSKASTGNILWLGSAVFLTMLTHYLSIGGILGLGIFAILRLRGESRRRVIWTLIGTALFYIAVWGPQFWRSRNTAGMPMLEGPPGNLWDILGYAISAPSRVLFGRFDGHQWTAAALAVLVFLLPLRRIKKSPAMLWWLWTVCSLGFVVTCDVLAIGRRPPIISLVRYSFIALPGVCVLISAPQTANRPSESKYPVLAAIRWVPAVLILLYTLACSIQRAEAGADATMDWRAIAKAIDLRAGPHDILAFVETQSGGSAWEYIAFQHYAPQSQRPVILVDKLTDRNKLSKIAGNKMIWVVSDSQSKSPTNESGSE